DPLFGQGGARPTLRIGSITSPIRLDGRLDESAWTTADSIPILTERERREGATPPGRTVARVLMDAEQIIIGVRVEYADSIRVVNFARERDAALSNEDHLKLILDTFRDGRSGYIFAVHANGARDE